jgi:hypothetical protein
MSEVRQTKFKFALILSGLLVLTAYSLDNGKFIVLGTFLLALYTLYSFTKVFIDTQFLKIKTNGGSENDEKQHQNQGSSI